MLMMMMSQQSSSPIATISEDELERTGNEEKKYCSLQEFLSEPGHLAKLMRTVV